MIPFFPPTNWHAGFNKVIVLTNRHSWQTHGGYHSQLQLDHSTLVLDHNVENLKVLKAALARCPDLRYLHGPYGDEAYNGPAGCPDAFDESCPDCPKAFVTEDVTRDLCSSDYGGCPRTRYRYSALFEARTAADATVRWKQSTSVKMCIVTEHSLRVIVF